MNKEEKRKRNKMNFVRQTKTTLVQIERHFIVTIDNTRLSSAHSFYSKNVISNIDFLCIISSLLFFSFILLRRLLFNINFIVTFFVLVTCVGFFFH